MIRVMGSLLMRALDPFATLLMDDEALELDHFDIDLGDTEAVAELMAEDLGPWLRGWPEPARIMLRHTMEWAAQTGENQLVNITNQSEYVYVKDEQLVFAALWDQLFEGRPVEREMSDYVPVEHSDMASVEQSLFGAEGFAGLKQPDWPWWAAVERERASGWLDFSVWRLRVFRSLDAYSRDQLAHELSTEVKRAGFAALGAARSWYQNGNEGLWKPPESGRITPPIASLWPTALTVFASDSVMVQVPEEALPADRHKFCDFDTLRHSLREAAGGLGIKISDQTSFHDSIVEARRLQLQRVSPYMPHETWAVIAEMVDLCDKDDYLLSF